MYHLWKVTRDRCGVNDWSESVTYGCIEDIRINSGDECIDIDNMRVCIIRRNIRGCRMIELPIRVKSGQTDTRTEKYVLRISREDFIGHWVTNVLGVTDKETGCFFHGCMSGGVHSPSRIVDLLVIDPVIELESIDHTDVRSRTM